MGEENYLRGLLFVKDYIDKQLNNNNFDTYLEEEYERLSNKEKEIIDELINSVRGFKKDLWSDDGWFFVIGEHGKETYPYYNGEYVDGVKVLDINVKADERTKAIIEVEAKATLRVSEVEIKEKGEE
ncbi:MAG: hypothetical protein CL489_10805 [Acidobacteria bacterium]|nr:hypothetical protein [Acidobacteriota bacterium]|tara:strand:- start:5254 stop:5634 length:381 start_codon:yes stop_codon:yes gene_type:complete